MLAVARSTRPRIEHLKNGLTVIIDKSAGKHSGAVNINVNAGTVDEDDSNLGIAHFVEHLVFKRTQHRTNQQILQEMGNVGAQVNAGTSFERTHFYARLLAENIQVPAEIYLDMLLNPNLVTRDFNLERGVVLEEIKMYDDSPRDLVTDLSQVNFHSGSPYGRFVLGTRESISNMQRNDARRFMGRLYTPENMIVSLAGNLDDERMLKLIEGLTKEREAGPSKDKSYDIAFNPGIYIEDRKINQANLCLAMKGYSCWDDRRYALDVLDQALGKDMDSRLFQEIREKRGLVYSIESDNSNYRAGGSLTIYAGCKLEKFADAIKVILRELKKIKKEGIAEDELNRAKVQLKTSLLLGSESTLGTAVSNAVDYSLYGQVVPLEEKSRKIEAVTNDDILAVANDIFKPEEFSLAVVAPKRKLPKRIEL